jgi:hypothetical protein
MSVHSIADHAKEKTMNPLLSATARHFRRPHRNRGRVRTGRRKARRRRPRLEIPEDRTVLSPTNSVAGATMSEIGAQARSSRRADTADPRPTALLSNRTETSM